MTRFREMLPDRTDVSVDWGYGAMMGAKLYIVGGGGRLKSVTQGRADPDDVQAATEKCCRNAASRFPTKPSGAGR
jgi:hypothetical protein